MCKRFYGVNLGMGDGKNNLVFPDGVTVKEKVTLSVITLRGAWRAHAMLDVGAQAGIHRFSGTPSVVVNRLVIDPYVAVRPFGWLVLKDSPNRAHDAIAKGFEFTLGATIYPEGFTVQDFGAIGTVNGTTLTGNAELIGHYGFKFWFTF